VRYRSGLSEALVMTGVWEETDKTFEYGFERICNYRHGMLNGDLDGLQGDPDALDIVGALRFASHRPPRQRWRARAR
jgi:hypothetical protein